MRGLFVVLSIILGVGFGFNNNEVSAEAKNSSIAEDNHFIKNVKNNYPDWNIIPLNTAKINKGVPVSTFSGGGEASPVTELYIDQVGSQLGTLHEYYEDIGSYQRTSHKVEGIVGIGVLEVGYGRGAQWLGDELITPPHRDYIVDTVGLDFNNDRIIDGFYHGVFFNLDAKIASGTSKLYKYRSISYNAPRNTMESFVNIPHK